MSSFKDLLSISAGRYSFSIAWYAASGAYINGWQRLGSTRWRLDVWRFGFRFERY